MKNFILMFLFLISTLTNAQDSNIQNDQINLLENTLFASNNTTFKQNNQIRLMLPSHGYSNNYNNSLGLGLLVSGAAFITGGLLTQPDFIGYNGETKPFMKQGPRIWAIFGGGLFFTTGLVIIII